MTSASYQANETSQDGDAHTQGCTSRTLVFEGEVVEAPGEEGYHSSVQRRACTNLLRNGVTATVVANSSKLSHDKNRSSGDVGG